MKWAKEGINSANDLMKFAGYLLAVIAFVITLLWWGKAVPIIDSRIDDKAFSKSDARLLQQKIEFMETTMKSQDESFRALETKIGELVRIMLEQQGK